MGIQEIAVALLFVLALIYIAQIAYKTIRAKSGCGSCGKCAAGLSEIKIPEQNS